MSMVRDRGWYWDDTPGCRDVLTFWNGRWWSARAHCTWDAETAGRQASFKAERGPAAFRLASAAHKPKPARLTLEEAQELRDKVFDMEKKVEALTVDPDSMRRLLYRVEALEQMREDMRRVLAEEGD